ncbi:RNA 2',3'-cyclic phosphodiesterase [Oceanobacillus sp. CAU 1775]
MTHYFLAIPIPETLKNPFLEWQEDLKKVLPYKRWMHSADLHITLQFLGEVSDSKLPSIIENIHKHSYAKSFIIELGSIGFFGNRTSPSVLWVDVKATKELLGLQEKVADVMESNGFPKEKRPYRPHVTLAKKWGSKSPVSEEKMKDLLHTYQGEQSFLADSFILYKIHPGQIPSYEEVAIFPLN